MTRTQFGVAFPTGMEGLMYPVPFCDVDDLVNIATLAEELGFHSIGGNDHIITQDYVKDEWEQEPNYYDIFNTFSFIAAQTEELVLNTAVTVLPLRDPVWVAKQATTVDVLSDGRLLLGVGVGAYREEFEAVKPEVDLPRGQIMDESVEAVADLLNGRGPVDYNGEHVRFDGVELHPSPRQDPLPIYVGGNHPNALRRAVRYGQGWLPAGMSVEQIDQRVSEHAAYFEEHGRSPDDLAIAPQLMACLGESRREARTRFGQSQLFEHNKSLAESTLKEQSLDLDDIVDDEPIGTPESVIDTLKEYVDIGITEFPGMIFVADTVADLESQMTMFAEEVMPSFQ